MHPTNTLSAPWETISVDFIVELPKVHGYDMFLMVVDSLRKRAHFIPIFTTLDAVGLASLYLQHVWKLHSLPNNVISDRGPQFVVRFTRELSELLEVKLIPLTTEHPQTNRQTKWVNAEIEQYLQLFMTERQDDWDTSPSNSE